MVRFMVVPLNSGGRQCEARASDRSGYERRLAAGRMSASWHLKSPAGPECREMPHPIADGLGLSESALLDDELEASHRRA